MSVVTTCYEYDGSAWTSGGTLTTGISQPGSTGIQTAAISMGGRSSSATYTTTSQQYDGTSWAASADTIGIATQQQKAVGTTTATIWFGGAQTNNSTVIANALLVPFRFTILESDGLFVPIFTVPTIESNCSYISFNVQCSYGYGFS